MASYGKILSILLLVIFLVPAAGFYYTRHSCHMSGDVRIVLDGDYHCCEDDAVGSCDLDSPAGTACCSEGPGNDAKKTANGEERQCCSNEGKYLKTDKEYSPASKVSTPQIEILVTMASVLDQTEPGISADIMKYAHPPPHLSSRHILLRNSVLLI